MGDKQQILRRWFFFYISKTLTHNFHVWCSFSILFYVKKKLLYASSVDPDQMPRFVALILPCVARIAFYNKIVKQVSTLRRFKNAPPFQGPHF